MFFLNIVLFIFSAFFELLGCYLMYQYLTRPQQNIWLGLGSVASLLVFAVLLTFEYKAGETGRTYLVYAGVYALMSMLWLAVYEKVPLSVSDLAGGLMILAGCAVIYKQILS